MSKTKHHTKHSNIFFRPTSFKIIGVAILCLCAWFIYLDAQVRYKFEGKRWALPAQVYARSLEIYNEKALNLNNLRHELQLLNYRAASQINTPGSYSINHNRIEIFSRSHSSPEGTQNAAHFSFTIVNDQIQNLSSLDNSNQALYSLDPIKIGGIYPQVKEERILLPYEAFPNTLKSALLLIEDRGFKNHLGISPSAITRAAIANLKAGRVVQGGSTLTQQLVKNFYLSRERSISRKVNEAFMSLLLEAHYSKQDILETYMNDIFLGQSGSLAIHGFAAASLFYFGKPLERCEIDEFALLVAMIKGPSFYNPRRFPERAIKRRNLILSVLQKEGQISEAKFTKLSQRKLKLVSKPKLQTNRYPAFMDLVKRQLSQDYHDADVRTEGLKIYTTLDPQVQHHLEQSIREQTTRLIQQKSEHLLQAAGVVTAVGTGEIIALVGDRQVQFRGFNRALDAIRPIGSLIKPAIFLTALEKPEKYHLASPLQDQAFKIEFTNGQTWEPRNFDKKEHGATPLHQALSHSYNLSSARLGLELGIEAVHETLRKLGIQRELNPYPSLFLGSQALSPLEVSQFYQTIASNGFNMPLRAIREVTDNQDNSLTRYPFSIERVISPEAVYLLQHALQEVMRSGTGRYAYQLLPSQLNVAGKTGTTNDNRDSWFSGFSGDYLATFWLGRDDNQATTLTGSSGALRVWTDFIKKIPQYPISVKTPGDIYYHWFDQKSGKLTDEHCEGATRLPLWGDTSSLEYQVCQAGFSSIKGWIKSWF
jgi:penicillin-binding protein 1B